MAFNPTVSLPGAVNSAGDELANFLKVFSGEVIAAYSRTTQFADKHKVRTITSGKSAQFPKSGRLPAANKYLARGDSVAQAQLNYGEQTISIDGQLYESCFLAKQDEAFSHFDVRQEHSRQLGESIAQYWDTTIGQVGVQAARSANVISGLPGGGEVTNASAGTDGNELFNSLFTARQILDEKDVNDQAYAFLSPAQYYLLAQVEKLLDKDVTSGENGGLNTGMVKGIAGLEVVKTNNTPFGQNVTGTINNKYDVDATDTVGLVMAPSAVGTVKLQDIVTEMDYMTEYQAWLMVSSIMVGHGVLQPEAAVEINTVANA